MRVRIPNAALLKRKSSGKSSIRARARDGSDQGASTTVADRRHAAGRGADRLVPVHPVRVINAGHRDRMEFVHHQDNGHRHRPVHATDAADPVVPARIAGIGREDPLGWALGRAFPMLLARVLVIASPLQALWMSRRLGY